MKNKEKKKKKKTVVGGRTSLEVQDLESELSMQEARVLSLVRELRSHMLQSRAKIIEKKDY